MTQLRDPRIFIVWDGGKWRRIYLPSEGQLGWVPARLGPANHCARRKDWRSFVASMFTEIDGEWISDPELPFEVGRREARRLGVL